MKFETIEEYYNYIESDISILNDYNIPKMLLTLRENTEDSTLKQHCSYELFFYEYFTRNGFLCAKISMSNGSSYPNLDLFDDDLQYIKLRASQTLNPKYRLKYNHLVWCSKFKHSSFAHEAIDNYLIFLTTVLLNVNDKLANHSFETYFQNLFTLAESCNHKKTETIQFFISILGKQKINGYKECALMKYIVVNGKKLDKETTLIFFQYANWIFRTC